MEAPSFYTSILQADKINVDILLTVVFVASCLFFIIHATIVSYHWYTYGSERAISLLSIMIYLGVGIFLLGAMGITLLAI